MLSKFSRDLLAPRHWPSWLGAGLWFLLAQLPYRVQFTLAKWVAPLLKKNKRRYRMAQINIARCFPHLSEQEQAAMLEANMFSMSMAVFETGIAWFWSKKRLHRLFTISGLEHIEAAQKEGKGALLLAMHFTHLDLGSAMLGQFVNYDGMYRPHKNAVYDYLQKVRREAYSPGGYTIPRDNVRLMINRLRQGRMIWYAPDRDLGPKISIFVPFFGVQAATVTATGTFARMGKALVIPFTQRRLENGKGYEVVFHPAFENYPTGDEYEDALRVNQFMEQQILRCPDQYFWAQPRFKTRPDGEPPFYPGKV